MYTGVAPENQLASGAILSVGGGILFAMGTRGHVESFDGLYEDLPVPASSAPLVVGSICSGWGCEHSDADPMEPDPFVMGLGAALLLTGGVTFHFGAETLRLAGPLVDPWAG